MEHAIKERTTGDRQSTSLTWSREPVRLSIRFGPIPLLQCKFVALVCQTHFSRLTSMPELPALQDRTDLTLVRSVPVEYVPKRFGMSGGLLYYVPAEFPHYSTDLQTTFEQYLGRFSSKTRSTLTRKVRKFREAAGTPEVLREYKTPDELARFYDIARPISAKTYQEHLLHTGLPNSDGFRSHMLALGSEDNVRAYTLHLGDKAVAYLYCPAVDGILIYEFLGYDPEFSDLSPGTVLQYLAFERLFAEGKFRLFDFEEGEGQHKRQFGTQCQTCADVYVFRASPKSIVYVGMHSLFTRLTRSSIRLFDKLGLRTRVRRLLR